MPKKNYPRLVICITKLIQIIQVLKLDPAGCEICVSLAQYGATVRFSFYPDILWKKEHKGSMCKTWTIEHKKWNTIAFCNSYCAFLSYIEDLQQCFPKELKLFITRKITKIGDGIIKNESDDVL